MIVYTYFLVVTRLSTIFKNEPKILRFCYCWWFSSLFLCVIINKDSDYIWLIGLNMKNKKVTALSHNIGNFIKINGLTRRQFADELDNIMSQYDDNNKIYTDKDVYGYESRSSKPDDNRVLVAMAQIIGKPLEDLLTVYFSSEELKLPQSIDFTWKPWGATTFNKLSEEEKNFILDLLSTDLQQDNERFYLVSDIILRYHEGKSVTATLYYGFNYEKEKTVEWTWTNYGKEMSEIGDDFGEESEAYLINKKLESEIFFKLWSIGLVDDFYCFKASADDYSDESVSDTNGHFIANVWFAIDKKEMVKLLEIIAKRAKKEYKRLLKEYKQQSKN